MKLLIVTNVDWFLISHRLVIAKYALEQGWEVYVACEDTGRGNIIIDSGIKFINFPLSRSGVNIREEIKTYRNYKKLYADIKPDVVHHITIKPVLYGSLAAKSVGVKGVVNAISGLGYLFTKGKIGIIQRILLFLLKLGGNRKNVSFIFQNNEDKEILKNMGVLDDCKSVHLIKGSGIDLEEFSYFPLKPHQNRLKILFPARMLWDKGVKELREASEILKDKYKDKIQFILVGKVDVDNKSAVDKEYLDKWNDGDYVVWKGHVNNMYEEYVNCDLVVLPSYREGLPKSLIEACAVGRPIITTNAIGCKDCVDEGKNGLKVDVGSSQQLAKAIETLVGDFNLMQKMSKEGRKKAEREFDVKDVLKSHLSIYKSLL